MRFDVIDAVRRGDRAFQGRGDESAHEVRAGADVHRADGDGGVFAARILADGEGAPSLNARDHDHQVDDQCEDWLADEEVGKRGSFDGW